MLTRMKNNPNSYSVSLDVNNNILMIKIKRVMDHKYWYCYDFDKRYDPRREKPKAWYNPNWFVDWGYNTNKPYNTIYFAHEQDRTEVLLMALKPMEELVKGLVKETV